MSLSQGDKSQKSGQQLQRLLGRGHLRSGENVGLGLDYLRVKTLEMTVDVMRGSEQSKEREERRKKKIRN